VLFLAEGLCLNTVKVCILFVILRSMYSLSGYNYNVYDKFGLVKNNV